MTDVKNLSITRNEQHAPVKPFLKWAGGKSQLIPTFNGFYPEELKNGKINYYYEPFVGSGAVFFDIARRYKIQAAYLFDVNEELILTYKVVQKKAGKLIDYLLDYKKAYLRLNEEKQKEFYYAIRTEFNEKRTKINYSKFSEHWIERAAQIIFLNKTCFNGLFRFNSKGEFNVPAGRYKNPQIVDERNLLKASELLVLAEIRRADFREMEKSVKPASFVYFDPPYRPISKTSAFTSYSKNGFRDLEQTALGMLFWRLNERNVKQMLSNSDPKNSNADDNFFDDLYKEFKIFRVPAKRMINSNAAKRKAINEIIVINYPVTK